MEAITPKQTDVYKLSAPMLFSFDALDKYIEYNKKYKKSQIKMLFQSIPWPQTENFNEWFMAHRFGTSNPNIATYADFDKYVQYAQRNGFEIIYLMNSPKAFNDRDIEPFKKDIYTLLDNLWNSGIRRIKFSNTQVAQIINEYNPNFQLSVAVIMEYSSIEQYRALLSYFPNINHICIPKDLNQNFDFLNSMKKAFPNIEFELMVGEGCPKWCPSRFSCQASSLSTYYKIGCRIGQSDIIKTRVKCGAIHPWQLEYYSALGFNHFKLLTNGARATDTDTSNIELYMRSIENGVDAEYLSIYCGELAYKLPQEECIALLPDIRHFVKNGYRCNVDCGVNCTYCDEYIKKIKERVYDNIN